LDFSEGRSERVVQLGKTDVLYIIYSFETILFHCKFFTIM
jgi:hypothetical protein